jgi:hypothetical protein
LVIFGEVQHSYRVKSIQISLIKVIETKERAAVINSCLKQDTSESE